jgi:hypothetical protein
MVRIALRLAAGAGLVLLGVVLVHAGPEEDQKIETTLKVTTALTKGSEALKCGHYREAVDVLEGQLALVGDNRAYLNALRDAYQGLILDLKQKNQEAEIARYQRRLSALDPGALLESKGAGNPRPPETPDRTRATPVSSPAMGQAQPQPVPERSAVVLADDPFSDANSVKEPTVQARGLLDQADRAYVAKQFDAARRLYDQAFQQEQSLDADVVVFAKERWAYCKLYGVGTSLNRTESPIPPQEMEREVRLALSMAPKLESYGKELLRKIQERQGPGGGFGPGTPTPFQTNPHEDLAVVEIRHLSDRVEGWSVCETANFRIYHKQTSEQVERVARAAEAARVAAARKWFGEVPATWGQRCEMYLHLNKEDYSRETKQPLDCPGHSSVAMNGVEVRSRRIDLHCDDLNMVYGVLPHETTHVVLAGRFGVRDLPRWADEGMAVLGEPRDRVEKHLRNLPQHQRDRQLFAIADLMQYKEYPEGRYIGAFYAQSVSVVDYLCQQQGPQVFSRFLRDGLRGGFEPALRQYYGFASFGDLQRRWQAATLGNGPAVADRGK